MGFSTNLNTVITIEKKGDVALDFETEISNFKESSVKRTISYTKVIGGLILPQEEKAISKSISFEFVVEDFDIIKLINGTATGSVATGSMLDFGQFDLYKIALRFISGSTYHNLFYYNAMVEEFNYNDTEETLRGKIAFTLPMKNINGDSNFLISSETYATATGSFDTLMGY